MALAIRSAISIASFDALLIVNELPLLSWHDIRIHCWLFGIGHAPFVSGLRDKLSQLVRIYSSTRVVFFLCVEGGASMSRRYPASTCWKLYGLFPLLEKSMDTLAPLDTVAIRV